MIEAFVDGFLTKTAQLFVVVAEPACRSRVARIASRFELRDTLRLAAFCFAQNFNRFVAGEHVGQIAVVDDVGDFLC